MSWQTGFVPRELERRGSTRSSSPEPFEERRSRASPDSAPGIGGWNTRKLALFLVVTLGLAVTPWLVENWPTQDGPSHLAVAHVLMHYGDHDAPFSQYVQVDGGTLRPSTLYYGALATLGAHFGLGAAEKVLVSLTVIALPLSVLLFLRKRAPERTEAAFLVLPLVTGWALAMGFVSYLLALSCAYCVLALEWEPAGATPPFRPWSLAGATGALFVCAWLHPAVFACTVVALLLSEGPRLTDWRTWMRLAIVGGPASAFIAGSYLAAQSAPAVIAHETKWETLWALVPGLVEYHIAYSAWELVPRGLALLLLFGGAWASASAVVATRVGFWGTSAASANGRVVVSFLALYFLMPKVLSDWYYCSARFLIFATFLLPTLASVPEALAGRLPMLGAALAVAVVGCDLPELVRLSHQMGDVVAVGSDLPRGAKLIPMNFMDRGWGAIDKPQPLSHAWARLVESRDVVASQLFAAGKPRMGGDRFRMLSFRPRVLDVATGTLPWSSFEGVYDAVRRCADRSSQPCRDALSERREALDAVIDRYAYVLMVSPPDYARDAFAQNLDLRRQIGVAWLYETRAPPAPAGQGGSATAPRSR